jgi:hypothetical protein
MNSKPSSIILLALLLIFGAWINYAASTDIILWQRSSTNEFDERRELPATGNSVLGMNSTGAPVTFALGTGLSISGNTINASGTGSIPANLTGITSITMTGGTVINEAGSSPKIAALGDVNFSAWSATGLARLGLWAGNSAIYVTNATNTAYEGILYMDGINAVLHGRNGGLHISGDQGVVFKSTNIVTFANTTESTYKGDGAVKVQGGLGVEKNLNVGNEITHRNGVSIAAMQSNAQTANYTLTAADNGKMIEHLSGSNTTYTINMTACNSDGFNFGVLNLSNTVIVTPSTGNIVLMQGNTTANNTSATLAAGSKAFFRRHSGGNWTVSASSGVTVP